MPQISTLFLRFVSCVVIRFPIPYFSKPVAKGNIKVCSQSKHYPLGTALVTKNPRRSGKQTPQNQTFELHAPPPTSVPVSGSISGPRRGFYLRAAKRSNSYFSGSRSPSRIHPTRPSCRDHCATFSFASFGEGKKSMFYAANSSAPLSLCYVFGLLWKQNHHHQQQQQKCICLALTPYSWHFSSS